jgi:H+-translocating NAD(P) transhydrogenase subunit beta
VNPNISAFLYLIAAVLFILGLKRLSSPATARLGNRMAALGMLLAVVVTLLDRQIVSYGTILAGLVVGAVVGGVLARTIRMTDMPQLVAAFNGFGGGASALVAVAEFARAGDATVQTGVTIVMSAFIGTITFSGSLVAFGKLQALMPGQPIVFPGSTVVDVLLAAGSIGFGGWVLTGGGLTALWGLTGVALLLGVTRVIPIGGADMPVVISLLNSLSGVAAAMAGFVIDSNALIVSGALVGAAGLILTNIMVKAMNRSLGNVLFGRFGGVEEVAAAGDKVARRAHPSDVAIALAYARSVIIVPGYGLAVAQAQHALRELDDLLSKRGVNVRYAIHPVAGRMPGHMNVLLAEADIPYDRLLDLDEINADFPHTDVAVVVGANDVVNPVARDDPSSTIAGMPILEVDRSRVVVVIKRSLAPGFAGIDNPLFYLDRTMMLFADAKQGLAALTAEIMELGV